MEDLGFPKRDRILDSSDYQRVYKMGRRFAARHFIFFCLKPKTVGARRLGITVAGAVGGAVERNRIKRQVREFFRFNKGLFPRGYTVVKARMSAARVKNSELREDLLRGLKAISEGGE